MYGKNKAEVRNKMLLGLYESHSESVENRVPLKPVLGSVGCVFHHYITAHEQTQ